MPESIPEKNSHKDANPAPATASAFRVSGDDLLSYELIESSSEATPVGSSEATPESSSEATAETGSDVSPESSSDPSTETSSVPSPEPPASNPLAESLEAMKALPREQTGGIEILIAMAEKGEIDPKNIDIIDVTDRFLRAIAAAPKENLRQSGKIIFQASVLLRMKAEALLAAKIEEDLNFGDDYVDFDIDGSPIIFDSNQMPIARQITLQDLERALVRQTKTRNLRHRRVTLEQLIDALREAEKIEQNRSDRKVKPRQVMEGYSEMRDMDDILDLAHDEDIEDVIARIESLLAELLEQEDLMPLLRIIESLGGRGDWVDAFLAVLFLSNAGKITLQQEVMYGPLYIARPDAGGNGQMPPASAGVA